MTKALRGITAVLVVCLLAGVVAVGVGTTVASDSDDSGQSTVIPNTNSTNYLSPINPTAENYERVGVDASSAAGMASQEIHIEHGSQTYEEELRSADPGTEAAVARQQLETIEQQLERIAENQEHLFEAYSNGELDSRTLLQRLVSLQSVANAEAENYDRARNEVELSAAEQAKLQTYVGALTTTQPLTDAVRTAITDSDEEILLYLQGNADGIAMAAIDDDRHVRQATLTSERNLDGEDRFKLDQNITMDDPEWFQPRGYSEAQSRLSTLYPWAYDGQQVEVSNIQPLSRIYELRLSPSDVGLTTYFDGATRNVFHENQERGLDSIPLEGPVTNSTDSLTVSLELTYDSGPLRVTVEDDGTPVSDATVEINEQTVGSTDTDGQLWTIQPLQGFDVTVTTPEDESATVSFP